MFLRKIRVVVIDSEGHATACPIAHLDSFCMRNFTNDADFDDTLPVANGLLEIGKLVPLDGLHQAMEAWFRRKLYLRPGETLHFTETTQAHTGYSS